MKVDALEARSIKDSRGMPTVTVRITAEGKQFVASVPSGKSTGKREAVEKRDPDGKNVQEALHGVTNIVGPALIGKEFDSLKAVDEVLIQLDGTSNKETLGANTTLAVSIAASRALAHHEGVSLWRHITALTDARPHIPKLYVNAIEGGVHADWAAPLQEHLFIIDTDTSAADAYQKVHELFEALEHMLRQDFDTVPKGDEGGFAPEFTFAEEPFYYLHDLAQEDDAVAIGIDAAASLLYKDGSYALGDRVYDREELLGFYRWLVNTFAVLSIEDPFAEDDVQGFIRLTEEIGVQALIVGDDLTVTNPACIREYADKQAGNAVIIKPNQIGTVTETLEAINVAHSLGWECIVSHRSGETTDTFIADLAVGAGVYGFKAGAPTQEERRVKYERLLTIEKEL